MKGQYKIVVANNKVHYEFVIRRNITILRGNSATGKTVLIELIAQYNRYKSDSGITLRCDKPCIVLTSEDWKLKLSYLADSIVFIDEDADFVHTHEFARVIQKTNNYYVIVTREDLDALPYSINEIYEIRESSKYMGIKPVYNEFHSIYSNFTARPIKPELIITEDSGTGFQFFSSVGFKCTSASGKSKIASMISSTNTKQTLIIADGAALGSDISDISQKIKSHPSYVLYAPESFEWLLLNAGIFKHEKEIVKVIKTPFDYIESRDYFSWERFFTAYLVRITTQLEDSKEMIGYKYPKDKGILPEAYKRKPIAQKILDTIPDIDFECEQHTTVFSKDNL